MAKKKTKKDIEKEEEEIEEVETFVEKHSLVELVFNCQVDNHWIIYNLSRVGLLQQFEQELNEYGQKKIEPTLTVEEFNKIIEGK